MEKNFLNRFLPYIAAVFIFIFITIAYFPEVLEGKRLSPHDIKTWKGGAKEVLDYKEEHGEHPLWTNSMFSGMPAYLISNYTPNNWLRPLNKTLNANGTVRPVSFIFWAMLGFFIALILFKTDPWLAVVGAIAYGFSSYFFIIIEAGHATKMSTLAYMPPIIAGVWHAYKNDMLKGTVVMTFFFALQLYRNHVQITYYTFIIILFFIVFHLFDVVKEKSYQKFLKTSAVLSVGLIVALMANASNLLPVYDYGKDSIRGKSELTIDKTDQTDGLDKSYAMAWSYGKLETFNLLIPNLMGGASMSELPEDSETEEVLTGLGVKAAGKITENMPTYWGPQPMTSGPVYIGAFVVFLFVLGLFIVEGRIRWWILAVTILSFLLAWGHNFNAFSEFFMNHIPGYNKFRTVSMILIIAEFTIPLLGVLALKEIAERNVEKKQLLKAIYWAGGIVGGIILIFLINPGILSFASPEDAGTFRRMFGLKAGEQEQIISSLVNALEADRKTMFQSDALRSLAFIFAGAIALLLFIYEKINKKWLFPLVGLIFLTDLWGVNKRYLNEDDFVKKSEAREAYTATAADRFILENDKGEHYRVANLSVNTFNDASTSYFHHSIGGYHGAKMRRYQELIDYRISQEFDRFKQGLSSALSDSMVLETLENLPVLNMLNTKYYILRPSNQPLENPARLGNAWFVEELVKAENANQEIAGLINPYKLEKVVKNLKERARLINDLKKISKKLENAEPGKIDKDAQDKLSKNYNTKMQRLQAVERNLESMNEFNPEKTAVANVKFKEQFFDFSKNQNDKIELTDYKPHEMSYKANCKSDGLAVFSEIYYGNKGWNAYLDGKKVPHFRVNYVLRAMKIPAGEHEIVFKFEPQIWETGNVLSLIGSILFVLMISGYIVYRIILARKSADDKTA